MYKRRLHVLAALVLLAASCSGTHWADDVSGVLARKATDILASYLQRNNVTGTCNPALQPDLATLEKLYLVSASQTLHEYIVKFDTGKYNYSKDVVFMQLDLVAIAPEVVHFTDIFNEENEYFTVSLVPTPPFTKPSDIVFNDVSTRADSRLTDLTNTGDDSIATDDPASRNGSPFFLFYRHDIFAAHNITVPLTWEELLEAAAKLNGTDFDGDGTPDHAICFNTSPVCTRSYYLVLGILGPMLQASSPAAGVFLDPDTLEPLVTTAAMHRALAIYANLSRFHNMSSEPRCHGHSIMFSKGKCAITFNQDEYKHSRESWPNVTGSIGTALLPGSPYALNRTTATLQPCTPALCPMATPHPATGALVNHAPLYTTYRTHFIPGSTITPQASAGTTTFSTFLTTRAGAGYILPLLTALGMMPSSPNLTTPNPPTPPPTPTPDPNPTASNPTPSPTSILAASASRDPSTSTGLDPSPLLENGYNRDDTLRFLPVFFVGYTHSNRVFDIALPGASYFRYAMAEGALNSTVPGANLTQVMATMDAKFRMVMTVFNDTKLLRRQYWSMIGYTPDAGAAALISAPHRVVHNAFQPAHIAAIVLPLVLVTLLATLIWLYVKAHHRRRTILGAPMAPGVGAATTLLVTDIQNSTVMWEQLPMDTMEEVLRLHNSVLRSLQDKHRAYESATEGDSFIIAFHCAADALNYALEAQQKLLEAPWPQALLLTFPEAAAEDAVPTGSADQALSYTVKRLQNGSHLSMQSLLSGSARTSESTLAKLWASRPFSISLSSNSQSQSQLGKGGGKRHLRQKLRQLVQPKHGQDVGRPDSGAASGSDHVELSLGEEDLMIGSEVTSGARSSTFGWALSQAWVHTDEEAAPADFLAHQHAQAHQPAQLQKVRVWRGLRVRMGIHSGLEDPVHVAYNRASHRTQYSGRFAATAKAVSDAGHGGQVLLSGEAFARLQAKDRTKGLTFMLMGEHVLKDNQPAQPLYQVVVPGLEARLHSFPPLRTVEQVSDGIYKAPVGTVTVVFMKAVGIHTLMAWNPEITRRGLQLYHSIAASLVPQYCGYVVEMADGLCLAAFQQPQEAIAWALAVQAGMLRAEWPKELLLHELCEPVYATLAIPGEDVGKGVVDLVSYLSTCGLRLKVGIDTDHAMDVVHMASGRMTYRGKVMNRAARIAAVASSGQVLCSGKCWESAHAGQMVNLEMIVATSIGFHDTLKGIHQKMELFSCTYAVPEPGKAGAVPKRASCRTLKSDSFNHDQEGSRHSRRAEPAQLSE